MATSTTLKVSDLVCGYAQQALFKPLSFELQAGQTVRILGANGIGKSTVLKTLVGLKPPMLGKFQWAEHARLCYIAHDNGLNGALTPIENLTFLLQIHGQSIKEKAIYKALEANGLGALARRSCGRLSAGQKRRVALTRLSFSMDKSAWLLDEPASALDTATRGQLGGLIRQYIQQGGAVIYTTHEALDLGVVNQDLVEPVPC